MKTLFSNSLLIAILIAFTACGGGESSEQQTAETAAEDDGIRTIEIIGTDDMRFAVREAGERIMTGEQSGDYILLEGIEAEPGEEIRIRLTTVSNLPPTAMSHNFALLELGSDADAFARASITARDNDYISPDLADQVIAHTAMLGNGESDSITFTVPEETGDYDYMCSFPGHFAGGMVGTLTVQ